MRLLEALRETTIGRALIAYFVDLPRWTLLNLAFALALVPSLVAGLRGGDVALALLLSFPAALVMAVLLSLLSVTVDGTVPKWSHLRRASNLYGVTFSAWGMCVAAGVALLTPLLYVVVIPALIVFLTAPLAMLVAAHLPVNIRQAWLNAFVIAVRYPMVALGLVLLVFIAVWVVVLSRGALIVALPALWAAIAAYTVDDVIRAAQTPPP